MVHDLLCFACPHLDGFDANLWLFWKENKHLQQARWSVFRANMLDQYATHDQLQRIEELGLAIGETACLLCRIILAWHKHDQVLLAGVLSKLVPEFLLGHIQVTLRNQITSAVEHLIACPPDTPHARDWIHTAYSFCVWL